MCQLQLVLLLEEGVGWNSIQHAIRLVTTGLLSRMQFLLKWVCGIVLNGFHYQVKRIGDNPSTVKLNKPVHPWESVMLQRLVRLTLKVKMFLNS